MPPTPGSVTWATRPATDSPLRLQLRPPLGTPDRCRACAGDGGSAHPAAGPGRCSGLPAGRHRRLARLRRVSGSPTPTRRAKTVPTAATAPSTPTGRGGSNKGNAEDVMALGSGSVTAISGRPTDKPNESGLNRFHHSCSHHDSSQVHQTRVRLLSPCWPGRLFAEHFGLPKCWLKPNLPRECR